MARHYNTKKFFRCAPNASLARYFQNKKVLTGLDFGKLKEGNPDPLFAAWMSLPASVRAGMEADFQSIFNMSDEVGTKAILDEQQFWLVQAKGLNQLMDRFSRYFSSLKNHYERAFRFFLKYPHRWHAAASFYRADRLAYWRKYPGFAQVPPDCTQAALDELAGRIGLYFNLTESKGRNCLVEAFRRRQYDYFFCYPEDYSQRSIEWVNNSFQPRPHNPAFEVIFVFSQQDGWIDLNYRGDKGAVEPLLHFFNDSILKQPELPRFSKDTRVYDLNPLMRRDFVFTIDPTSGIDTVALKRLRLTSKIDGQWRRIILEAKGPDGAFAIHDYLDEIQHAGFSLTNYKVTQVDLVASVNIDPNEKPRNIPFTLTDPNSCSLKYDELGLKLRAMLTASGIEPKPPSATSALRPSRRRMRLNLVSTVAG